MIMKELTSVETNTVFGGGCVGGHIEMCMSATPKTGPTTGACSSTTSGYDKASNLYYYCYDNAGSASVDTMAADINYCDFGDDHYYQDGTAAGKNGIFTKC